MKSMSTYYESINLNFLYHEEESKNLKNIYDELCKIESITVFHNGYYLPIYFKKSQFKIGKSQILDVLKNYNDYEFIRFNGGYRVMRKDY